MPRLLFTKEFLIQDATNTARKMYGRGEPDLPLRTFLGFLDAHGVHGSRREQQVFSEANWLWQDAFTEAWGARAAKLARKKEVRRERLTAAAPCAECGFAGGQFRVCAAHAKRQT